MSTRVIGVGSPFGDDRAGWEVVAALETALRSVADAALRIDIRACDRPGAALVRMLAGVQHAVIIDAALSSGSPAGSVRWLGECEIDTRRAVSSHGFGLAEALALARALGEAPSRVSVLTISAACLEGEALSDPVREAVPVAVREVLAHIRRHDADTHGPGLSILSSDLVEAGLSEVFRRHTRMK
jgi:hydrogenase maturation protease